MVNPLLIQVTAATETTGELLDKGAQWGLLGVVLVAIGLFIFWVTRHVLTTTVPNLLTAWSADQVEERKQHNDNAAKDRDAASHGLEAGYKVIAAEIRDSHQKIRTELQDGFRDIRDRLPK